MSIVIACPACGKKGRVPASFQGDEIKCSACKAKFEIEINTTLHMSEIKNEEALDRSTPSEVSLARVEIPRRSRKKYLLVIPILIVVLIAWHGLIGWIYPNYVSMGVVARERGDFASAEEFYRKAIDQGGSDEHMAVSWAGLGVCETENSKLQDAEISYGKSIELMLNIARSEKNDVWKLLLSEVLENLGKCQMKQGKQSEAAKNYALGSELEYTIKGYRMGVERPLNTAIASRKANAYDQAEHWIHIARMNAIAFKDSPADVAIWEPTFIWEEAWPRCLREQIAIYQGSGKARDEQIADQIMMMERTIEGMGASRRSKLKSR